jgi:protein O-GlcNAc transferase
MENNLSLLQQAQRLFAAGHLAEATGNCEQFLNENPRRVDAWILLITLWQRLKRFDHARNCLNQALMIEPFKPALHSLAGDIYADEGRFDLAEPCYRRALAADRKFHQAHNALGITLTELKRTDEAAAAFRLAVEHKPDYFYAWNNLGSLLMTKGDLAEAEKCFSKALSINPRYAKATQNLAACAAERGDDGEAEKRYLRTLEIDPKVPEAILALAQLRRKHGDYPRALAGLQESVKLRPDDPIYLNAWGEALWEVGDVGGATAAFEIALKRAPANLKAAIGAHLLLPIIYRDRAHVDASRRRFLVGLAALNDLVPTLAGATPASIEHDIPWANFYLAYQGLDDRAPQAAYAGIVRQLLQAASPNFFSLPENVANRGRLRIGFVSNKFYDCTAGRYFQSWITRIDAQRFETFVYHVNHRKDALTQTIESAAGTFRPLNGLRLFEMARTIASDQLDVLVYPELGMHGMIYALGALRLARVQCVGWGHPVTTGHANIDYFLSSDIMEPVGAEQHYTETLVRLPGLGTHYTVPAISANGSRADFQLPDDKILYLVPQSLFKIHPDNDALFIELLEREPRAVIVMFVAERSEILTKLFVDRLQRQFEQRGLETGGRLRILPRLGHEDYMRLNQLCDVMLDTLHWSGGNTSLDAIAAGLPIVTLPGSYMRGRQTAGMLEALGCEELVVSSREAYLDLALRLGRDEAYRASLSKRLTSERLRLFEHDEPVRAFEQFLISAAAGTVLTS